MNEILFQLVFWGLILFGGPVIFFLIPYFYAKTLDKVEDEKLQKAVERQTWLQSKKIFIALSVIGTIFYVISIVFVAKADYSNIESVYYNSLLGDIARYFAWIFWGTIFLLFAVAGLAEKINFPEKKLFTFIFSIGFLIVLGFSINQTVKELIDKPHQVTGLVSEKREIRSGRKIPTVHYYIKISKDDFELRGDNLDNGYESVQEGDRVRVWFGKYSRKAFLVEKLSNSGH